MFDRYIVYGLHLGESNVEKTLPVLEELHLDHLALSGTRSLGRRAALTTVHCTPGGRRPLLASGRTVLS